MRSTWTICRELSSSRSISGWSLSKLEIKKDGRVINEGLERSFVVIHRKVFHPAAGLDIKPGAAFIILNRLPTSAGGKSDPAEIVVTVFSEFLDVQECPKLNELQRSVPVFGNLHM